MRIFEVTSPSPVLLAMGKQLAGFLDKVSPPSSARIRLTKHLLTKMNKYAIRPSSVAAMVKKAFRFHGKRLEQLPVNDRIILRKTDRTGLVVVKNAQGDYVLVTIDPTLYNTEHPSPELAV